MPKVTAKTRVISKSVPAGLASSLFGDEKKGKGSPKLAAAPKAKAKAKPAAKKAPAKKPAVKKVAPAKKPVAKKTPAKKPVARKTRRTKKVSVPVKAIKTKFTKAGLLPHLADAAGSDKKTAKLFMDGLTHVMLGSIAPRGAGTFTLPGVLRIVTRKVPARKGGKMVLNRFTGEQVKQKAKPASVRVRVRPMAALKNAALAA